MKKVFKVILFLVLILIVFYVGKMLYGLWIWNHISSNDQIKITQSAYEKCLDKGKENCESLLGVGIKGALSSQRKEAMGIILDRTKSVEQRLDALETFYLSSKQDQSEMSQTEIDLYYLVAMDLENPLNLSQSAFTYLLKEPTQDEKIIDLQIKIAQDPEADLELRKFATMSLAKSKIKKAEDVFFQIINESGESPRFWAGQGLIAINAINKIPGLIDLALNENKPESGRSIALETLNELIQMNEIKEMDLKEKLAPLLNHSNIAIKIKTENILEYLTGEKYGNDELTEEEAEEYMSNLLDESLNLDFEYLK